MPKNYVILGRYSTQKDRDENISNFELAESLSPEICLDVDITHTKTTDEDSIMISINASSTELECLFSVASEISALEKTTHFKFGDLFDNKGQGVLDLSTSPITLNLEITTLDDESTVPYYKKYELFEF